MHRAEYTVRLHALTLYRYRQPGNVNHLVLRDRQAQAAFQQTRSKNLDCFMQPLSRAAGRNGEMHYAIFPSRRDTPSRHAHGYLDSTELRMIDCGTVHRLSMPHRSLERRVSVNRWSRRWMTRVTNGARRISIVVPTGRVCDLPSRLIR